MCYRKYFTKLDISVAFHSYYNKLGREGCTNKQTDEETDQISEKHRPIELNRPNFVLDLRYVASFLNQNDSKATVIANRIADINIYSQSH